MDCEGEGVCAVASLAWLLACAALKGAALTVAITRTKNTRSQARRHPRPLLQRRPPAAARAATAPAT